MTDIENLDEAEGRELSGYAKQRAKHKEEMDQLRAELDAERAGRIADKKDYFTATLTSQGYKGDLGAFADKYADKLGLEEMVALYKGSAGVPSTTPANVPEQKQEQPTQIGPQSVIGTNPLGGGTKTFGEMSIDEMKDYARSHPELLEGL